MSARSRLVIGVVLIVIAALWLLRGIVFLLTVTDGTSAAGSMVGLLLAALLLVLGVSLVRRGRRVPS